VEGGWLFATRENNHTTISGNPGFCHSVLLESLFKGRCDLNSFPLCEAPEEIARPLDDSFLGPFLEWRRLR